MVSSVPLAIAQRGSRRRFKVKRNLARHAARTGSERRDFTHELLRTLVNRYSHIALENLNVTGLARGMLAKSVLNAAGGQLILFTDDKAAETGGLVAKVDPLGTFQEWDGCGQVTPKYRPGGSPIRGLANCIHDCPG